MFAALLRSETSLCVLCEEPGTLPGVVVRVPSAFPSSDECPASYSNAPRCLASCMWLHSRTQAGPCLVYYATRRAEQAKCDNLTPLRMPAGMPSCPGIPEASRTQKSRHRRKQHAAEHQTSALPALPSCLGLARCGLGILCLGLGGLKPLPHVICILAVSIVLGLPIMYAARMNKSELCQPCYAGPCTPRPWCSAPWGYSTLGISKVVHGIGLPD